MNLLTKLLAVIAVVALSGCARTQPPPDRIVRLVVLNGVEDYETAPEGNLIEKGWWFSSRQRYESGNVGVQVAEMLATEFQKIPGVEVYSRDDYTIYMAQKERLLRRNYPDLTTLQRKELLYRQDPVDYGRSLNVDYVIRPHVEAAGTVANHFWGWWYSTLHADVEVWSVETGEVIWKYRFDDTDNFDSQLSLMEELARQARKRAQKLDVFRLGRGR